VKDQLAYGEVRKTVEEVKAELQARGHPLPPEERWSQSKVTTGIGIYDTEKGILHYWLIGVSDETGGR
jgi:hypothetical protein